MSDGDMDWEEGFYILRKSWCPAVLTENFFMDTHVEYLSAQMSRKQQVFFNYFVFWLGTSEAFICGKIYCAMFGVIIFLVLCIDVLGTMCGGNSSWGEQPQ